MKHRSIEWSNCDTKVRKITVVLPKITLMWKMHRRYFNPTKVRMHIRTFTGCKPIFHRRVNTLKSSHRVAFFGTCALLPGKLPSADIVNSTYRCWLCVFGELCVDMWRLVHQWSFLLFDCFWPLVYSLVMLHVFRVMLHVFPVTLQETRATLQMSNETTVYTNSVPIVDFKQKKMTSVPIVNFKQKKMTIGVPIATESAEYTKPRC